MHAQPGAESRTRFCCSSCRTNKSEASVALYLFGEKAGKFDVYFECSMV